MKMTEQKMIVVVHASWRLTQYLNEYSKGIL